MILEASLSFKIRGSSFLPQYTPIEVDLIKSEGSSALILISLFNLRSYSLYKYFIASPFPTLPIPLSIMQQITLQKN